ncbi:MAG: hypothetical protein ACKPKO_52265 [Candidatus Fonsibacter sp.]
MIKYFNMQNMYMAQCSVKALKLSCVHFEVGVLLLAYVFDYCRSVYLGSYTLHQANYLTTPGMAWQSMLLLTKVQLTTGYRYPYCI